MATLRTALLVVAYALLSACATTTTFTDTTLDVSEPPSAERQFDCVVYGPDGRRCDKKECRAGPGGATFYCDTYAYACVKAGHRWEGTKVKGWCIRTHPN